MLNSQKQTRATRKMSPLFPLSWGKRGLRSRAPSHSWHCLRLRALRGKAGQPPLPCPPHEKLRHGVGWSGCLRPCSEPEISASMRNSMSSSRFLQTYVCGPCSGDLMRVCRTHRFFPALNTVIQPGFLAHVPTAGPGERTAVANRAAPYSHGDYFLARETQSKK